MTMSADERSVATRWSMTTNASATGTRALAELCARYRYPVYAYLRRVGETPAQAGATANRFLEDMQRRAAQGPPSGREFRRFLLGSLEEYGVELRDRSADSPAGETSSSALEARYAHDAPRADSPAQAFERGFAIDVLLGAMTRLRDEARATGHGAMYAALAPYVARDPRPDEAETLAATLRMRPLAIAVALKRLRQRLRELAGEELADTVSSTAELAGEQAAMLAALGGAA
jgi:RNA polymerase sigma-70 factor (ECF subfamily)